MSLLPLCPLQDSGFLDGAFESQNAALGSLSRLLYDELVKSILRIVEKLDLSVQKVTAGEEVRYLRHLHLLLVIFSLLIIGSINLNIIQLVFRSLSVYLIHGTFLFVCQAVDDAAHILPSSDPTAHLLPNKIKDFTAFINLVEFCR